MNQLVSIYLMKRFRRFHLLANPSLSLAGYMMPPGQVNQLAFRSHWPQVLRKSGHHMLVIRTNPARFQHKILFLLFATNLEIMSSNSENNNLSNQMMEEDDDSKIFPQRLMEILSDERYHDSISWLPHGRAFVIKNRKLFGETVMPKYFSRKAKYSSFTRKLNRWYVLICLLDESLR